MILAVSTSSPLTSVALFGDDGVCLASLAKEAPRAASAAVIDLLTQLLTDQDVTLESMTGFVSDVGPGSFTGVKVGLTLVKAWGYAFGKPVAGVTAFDLIDPSQDVAIPSRRGEVYLRRLGDVGFVTPVDQALESVAGYSELTVDAKYPDASRVRIAGLEWVSAVELAAAYVGNPSISQAKRPHIMGGAPVGDQ